MHRVESERAAGFWAGVAEGMRGLQPPGRDRRRGSGTGWDRRQAGGWGVAEWGGGGVAAVL
jgi:hypothetical protein